MRQLGIVAISFRAFRPLKNADYPSSVDLALKEDIARVVAEFVA